MTSSPLLTRIALRAASTHTPIEIAMNRRKKVNQILKKKARKANAKLNPKSKPRYISKAERTKQTQDADQSGDSEQR